MSTRDPRQDPRPGDRVDIPGPGEVTVVYRWFDDVQINSPGRPWMGYALSTWRHDARNATVLHVAPETKPPQP